MGCQTRVTIGASLTFSICTHDPDTGELTDTDFAPTYRIYEDEIAAPILTGAMAKLDDANTAGFYTERIACSAANGFKDGKSYTVYIRATVFGGTRGIAFSFVTRAWIIPGVAKVTLEHWPDIIAKLEHETEVIAKLEHEPDIIVGLEADP